MFIAVAYGSNVSAYSTNQTTKSSVKAFDYLDTDSDSTPDTYRYNGDTLYVSNDVEIVNYNDLLTSINNS